MKTATNAPKKPKSSKNSGKPSFSPEDVERAIREAFPARTERPSIRYLWTDGPMHRYRVNWWSTVDICESKFLHVSGKNDKIEVIEIKDE